MQKITPFKLFVGAVCLLVAGAVVTGMYLAGSPANERRRQIDVQRVNALSQISGAVDGAYAGDGHLPASLEALVARASQKNDIYVGSITDPVTGAQYEYRIIGGSKYELCATFDAPVDENYDAYGSMKPRGASPASYGYPGYRTWEHGAGRDCFELDAVSAIPTVACSITNPCVAPNTTCAQLPGRGTFCVPQGKECLAAGCDEAFCTIAESYPVQVKCNDLPAHAPEPGASSCTLMQEKGTGRVDCYGCGGTVCKTPTADWAPYEAPEIGIPYSCYVDDAGACALAQ